MEPEWRKIAGYDYYVSSTGEVRNFDGIHLKQHNDKDGYKRLALSKDGKQKMFIVHRLVGQAFIPNPENKPLIDHIDRNKSNNNVSNLRWATPSENNLNRDTKKSEINERYIAKSKYNTYKFKISRLGIQKSFNTLEEAINYRDEYLNNN